MEKVENTAVLNERNRLAGEIHDTIGHSLTTALHYQSSILNCIRVQYSVN
ncbi:MAG TPA: hypothetical protein DCL31_04035 [Clostridium sp.]|nr:hypothetical protein [Clostridium sp.]